MSSDKDLISEVVLLNTLRKHDTYWIIKVLVIGSTSIKEYKKGSTEGIRKAVTLVDEEGTKVSGVLFNDNVLRWKNIWEQGKICYIINGRINGSNPNYQSVNRDIEVAFIHNTIVQECNSHFSTVSFSNNFVSFEDAKLRIEGTNFDILGIFVSSKAYIGEKTKRREIILMNEKCDRKTITLWGESSELDDELVQKYNTERPVIAFCDVKSTQYQGNFGISFTSISNMWINPTIENAIALQKWSEVKKKQHKDITLLPSLLIKQAKQVTIEDISHGSFDYKEVKYCKFNATIKDITNINDPWYESCNKCYKKVDFKDDVARCYRCRTGKIEYEERFLLKLEVFHKKEQCHITLFEATRYLLDCDATTYKQSISEKKEESPFYRKLVQTKEKEYTFLIKVGAINEGDRAGRRFIAEEVQQVEKSIAINIEDEELSSETSIKKLKQIEEEEEGGGIISKPPIRKQIEDDNNDTITHKRIKIEKN